MKKSEVYLISASVFSGWFLTGWGYSTELGHPVSTIAFLLGIALVVTGVVLFIQKLTQ
ncbi:hypothetical protein GZH53_00790 [Flavihumibacter sp. R14]|nr:hypothetical protein [Flavihumibacter soli]